MLPFAVVIFPGLYPIAAAVPAPAGPATQPAAGGDKGQTGDSKAGQGEYEDEFGEPEEFTDYADESSEFDEFDDFAEEVEEEKPQPKKKGRK